MKGRWRSRPRARSVAVAVAVVDRRRRRLLVVASFGGNPKHPTWFTKVAAQPNLRVQLGFRRWRTRAAIPNGVERDRLWHAIAGEFPRYSRYQAKTERQIPVVVLPGLDLEV